VLNLAVGSPVTKGDRNCIMTRPAAAGHAVYGPYQRLPAGRYAVEFNITAAEGQQFDNDEVCAVVDVASEFGRFVSASQKVLLSQLRDGPLCIRLDFNVTRPETFEFRVAVNGSASLLVEDVPPISSALAPDEDPWGQLAKEAQTRKDALRSFGQNAFGILADTPNGLFAVDPEDGGVSAYILREGSYMDEECKLAQSVIPTDGDVLVVGTHIGAHAIRLAKACATLVAIEANPKTFRFLSANLALNNCSNVQAFNIAAADKEGKIEFLLSRANSGGSKRAPTKMYLHYAYDNPEVIEIDCVPLDNLLGVRRFDLIIMDIEGSEYFALKGMQGILSASRALSVEFLPHHINDVANVSIHEFIETILPHFEWMYVSRHNKIICKHAIAGVIVKMYQANEGHEGLYFMKDLSANWLRSRGIGNLVL
jgi:FkbM family methyltransferase